jgi:hypothetical protein
MSTRKYVVSAAADSLLPRDCIVNTLFFNHTVGEPVLPEDVDAICADLATLFQGSWYGASNRQIKVTAYEVGGVDPHFPVGSAIINTGLSPESPGPRETALCLSFFGERNVPRKRGRIYLAMGPRTSDMAVRPTVSHQTQAMAMATGFHNIGGINVDWSVHSTVTGDTEKVQYAWCDNEWDTVRKRGLKATGRLTAAVGE